MHTIHVLYTQQHTVPYTAPHQMFSVFVFFYFIFTFFCFALLRFAFTLVLFCSFVLLLLLNCRHCVVFTLQYTHAYTHNIIEIFRFFYIRSFVCRFVHLLVRTTRIIFRYAFHAHTGTKCRQKYHRVSVCMCKRSRCFINVFVWSKRSAWVCAFLFICLTFSKTNRTAASSLQTIWRLWIPLCSVHIAFYCRTSTKKERRSIHTINWRITIFYMVLWCAAVNTRREISLQSILMRNNDENSE